MLSSACVPRTSRSGAGSTSTLSIFRVRPSVQRIIDMMGAIPAFVRNGRSTSCTPTRLRRRSTPSTTATRSGRRTRPGSHSLTLEHRRSTPTGIPPCTTWSRPAGRGRPEPVRPQPVGPCRTVASASTSATTRVRMVWNGPRPRAPGKIELGPVLMFAGRRARSEPSSSPILERLSHRGHCDAHPVCAHPRNLSSDGQKSVRKGQEFTL